MARHQAQRLAQLHGRRLGSVFQLAMLVGGRNVSNIRPLPDRRHAAVDRHRLVARIKHRQPVPRRAHHRGQDKKRVPKIRDRLAAGVQVTRVVGIHEGVAAGLDFGIDAGRRLDLERAGTAAADDRTIQPLLAQLLDRAARALDRMADQLLPLLDPTPVLRAALVGLQAAEPQML